MDKINIEDIWKKHYMNHYDERDNIISRKAAVKEIVEAVIDKCAEEANWDSTSHDIGFGRSQGYDFIDTDYAGDPSTGHKVFVNKDSILNVKKMIDYE